jgi:hypothetical protein
VCSVSGGVAVEVVYRVEKSGDTGATKVKLKLTDEWNSTGTMTAESVSIWSIKIPSSNQVKKHRMKVSSHEHGNDACVYIHFCAQSAGGQESESEDDDELDGEAEEKKVKRHLSDSIRACLYHCIM